MSGDTFIEKDFPILLGKPYDAALDPEVWPGFRDALRRPFGNAKGLLHLFDATVSQTPLLSFGTEVVLAASASVGSCRSAVSSPCGPLVIANGAITAKLPLCEIPGIEPFPLGAGRTICAAFQGLSAISWRMWREKRSWRTPLARIVYD